MRRFAIFALASLSSLLVASRAHATVEFPEEIVLDLKITCPNPIWDGNGCMICHTDNTGGLGSATKPFGMWAKQNGLTPFNDSKLTTLLGQLESESPHTTDTNCDGTPDIDQLMNCEWQALAVDKCMNESMNVLYGCSASPAVGDTSTPALPASAAIGVAGVLAAVILRARKRARSATR